MVGLGIRSGPWRRGDVLRLSLAAIAYFIVAKGGLEAASLHVSASPIWPATGLALAIVLLWGNRMGPAILVGAFLANITTAGSPFTASATAIGNTLEALVGAWLLTEWSGGLATFKSPERVFRFVAVCAFSGTVVSATIGVGSLAIAGYVAWDEFALVWITWWLGDVTGALLVTPAIVLWVTEASELRRRQLLTTLAVILLAALVGVVAFSPLFEKSGFRGFLALSAIVPLMWAAGCGSQRDTVSAALVLSAFAVWGATVDRALISTSTLNGTLLLLVAFILTATIPSLVLSAHVTERRRWAEVLGARTRELETVLSTVPVSVWIAHDPEARLVTGNLHAAEALRIDPGSNHSMSAPRGEQPGHFKVHRDGKEVLPEELPVQRAARGEEVRGEIIETVFDDGSSLWLLVNASPIPGAEGRSVGAVAAAMDVTEQVRSEKHLELLSNELDHRAKNMLANLQAILLLTFGSGPQTEAALGRIKALAKAHDRWKKSLDGMGLQQLIEEVLEPFSLPGSNSRFSARGPEVRLNPHMTEQLSLGLYELVTNAVKHGALSGTSGRIDVLWEIASDDVLSVSWRESGGRAVVPPKRHGLGTIILQRALNAQLAFEPGGLICLINLQSGSWSIVLKQPL